MSASCAKSRSPLNRQFMPVSLCLGILVYILMSTKLGNSQDPLWCGNTYSCGGKANSMCLYKPEINKTNCINMTEEFKNKTEWWSFWLALHNTLRDQVAAGNVDPWPRAADMRQLTWDSTLEEQSRIWNHQCFLNKPDNCNRNEQYKETQIGQVQTYVQHDDLHDHCSGNESDYFKEFLKDLFLEVVSQYKKVPGVSDMVKNGFRSNPRGLQYFFSVLLYANTMMIGGSVIRSVWIRHPNRIVRANTYFAPWYKGLGLYTKGYPCSKCPKGWSCNKKSTYKYLCAQLGNPDVDGEYVAGVPGPGGATRMMGTTLPLSLGYIFVIQCL